jgi:hypothetical protein
MSIPKQENGIDIPSPLCQLAMLDQRLRSARPSPELGQKLLGQFEA